MTKWETLAINGGSPVLADSVVERRVFGEGAKRAVDQVVEGGNFWEWYGGPKVKEFEEAFCGFHRRKHGVLMSSGTAALHMSYSALGLQKGDEVIIPALGFISDVSTLLQVGGVPVYADIDPVTWQLDPEGIRSRITPRTRAILAIHMFGQPVDMPALMQVARGLGLFVIEDCGQAHGAKIGKELVGSFGDIASFSLAARKHITTGGQGGINLTDNEAWASEMRALIHFGKRGRYDFVTWSYNYQITELQAAIGLVSLDLFPHELERFRRNAAQLIQLLRGTNLEFPATSPRYEHAYFKVVFLLPEGFGGLRDWFSRALSAEGIPNMYYPLLPDIEWLRQYPYRSEPCPIAEDVCARLITIPTAVRDEAIPFIAEGICKVMECLEFARERLDA